MGAQIQMGYLLAFALWAAFASGASGPQNAKGHESPEQNASILTERPDFVTTVSGLTNVLSRCPNCSQIHTGLVRHVEAADAAELNRWKEPIRRALSKYPINVVTANLDRVYIVRQLEAHFADSSWRTEGGVTGLRAVYLVGENNTEPAREAVFHHEFCHLLLASYREKFPWGAWLQCNPRGFGYLDYLPLPRPDPEPRCLELEDGFICSYGRQACAEDVCTFAMCLFTRAD
jgi:hypothetical protein